MPIDPVTGAYNAIIAGDNPFGFIYAEVLNPDRTFGLTDAELDG